MRQQVCAESTFALVSAKTLVARWRAAVLGPRKTGRMQDIVHDGLDALVDGPYWEVAAYLLCLPHLERPLRLVRRAWNGSAGRFGPPLPSPDS